MKLSRSRLLLVAGAVTVASGVGLTLSHTRGPGAPDVGASSVTPKAVAFDESTAVMTGEDEYSTIYTDANGVNRAMISAEPQHVFVDDAWQSVSSELEVDTTGSITAPLHPMTPDFAPVADSTELLSVTRGDSELTMGLSGIDPVAGRIQDQSELGMESGVVYSGAVSGSDLVFGLDNGLVRQAVVLATAPEGEAPTYEWNLSGAGLTERTNDFGDIEFVAATGEVAFTMLPPVMWDSSGSDGVADSATEAVDFTMVESAPGRWTVTLHPSLEWLADPSREYPVYIDPSVGVGVVGIHAYKEDRWTLSYGSPVRVGNSKQTSICCAWRTVMRFNMDAYFDTQALASTHLDGTKTSGWTIGRWGELHWASAFSWNGVGAYLSTYVLDTYMHETTNGSFAMAATEVNNNDTGSYEMLSGDESNTYYSYKALTLWLVYDYVSLPTATGISAVSARDGDLTASPIVEGLGTEYTNTGILMKYAFTTTTPGALNWTSPWVGPGPYRVPAGALTPGAEYTYTYSVMDNYAYSPVVDAAPDPSVRRFRMDAPPGVPTGVTVDGFPLTQSVAANSTRPTVCATVSDPDGGVVQARFTVKQDGITILDSLAGADVTVTTTSTGESCATIPYALSAESIYTLEVESFGGYLSTAMPPPGFGFGVPPDGSWREIPGTSDGQTQAVATS